MTDPTEALAFALVFQPHAVVLDYLMPQMHGGDVAWQLASNPLLRNVRMVVTSGCSAEEIKRQLPPANIPILPKPVDSDALLALLKEADNSRAAVP